MSYIGANAQGIIASIDGGTIRNATLDSTVTFPAGTVLQVAQVTDSKAFSYTNTTSWNFGNSTTRGDDSHGGVASNLNVTMITKGVNSNFLICANLQNTGTNAVGYTWAMRTYWSVDSYANPLVVGDPATHGVYSSGAAVQSGFWGGSTGDSDWFPHFTQILKTSNTIQSETSITFKIVISSYYTSSGNTLYYNRQHSTNNAGYRLIPVSTHTVYEIAT